MLIDERMKHYGYLAEDTDLTLPDMLLTARQSENSYKPLEKFVGAVYTLSWLENVTQKLA